MADFQLQSYGDDEGPMVRDPVPGTDEAEFKRRFIAHMVARAGADAGDYARGAAHSYWLDYQSDPLATSPEECAEADMDEWEPV